MKKIILLAAFSIVISASAQHSHDVEHRSFSKVTIEQTFEDDESFSQQKPVEIGIQSYKQLFSETDMIRILDSVYIWLRDTTLNMWRSHKRIMDLTYDVNNRFISETWQEMTGSEWVNTLRLSFSYDISGNMLSQSYENWNGSWVNNQRSVYTYDNRNNRTSRSSQIWDGSYWTNIMKWTYTYDDNDNVIAELFQSGSDTTWHNVILRTFNYNVFNYSISQLKQSWTNNNWENDELTTYSYDTDTILILQVQQNWNNSEWVNSIRYTYSYTGSNKWTGRLKETWQNGWINSQLITKTYDAHNNWIGELVQVWDGSWVNDLRYILAYDSNDNRIEQIMHFWNGEAWANYYKDNRTYDPNNFIITFTSTEWAENGIDTVVHDSTHYYFHTLLEIPDHQIPRSGITIYPNPASERITVEAPGAGRLDIFNMQGRREKIVEMPGPVVTLDINCLNDGLYLLVWQGEHTKASICFIVAH